ncbi:MAG: flagellar FlbD family protein [Clostridia bacterium]
MIILTKLDGTQFVLNSQLIETIDKTPDTIVRLAEKKYFIVQEDLQEIIDKVVEYQRYCREHTFLNIDD